MAEGESLAANSLSSQVIDFVKLGNPQSSNPAPGSELSLENRCDLPQRSVRIPHGALLAPRKRSPAPQLGDEGPAKSAKRIRGRGTRLASHVWRNAGGHPNFSHSPSNRTHPPVIRSCSPPLLLLNRPMLTRQFARSEKGIDDIRQNA